MRTSKLTPIIVLFVNLYSFSLTRASTSAPCSTSTFVGSSTDSPTSDVKTPIYVGGFFPIEGHWAFESLPRTAQTAIDHVNELPGILDDYELRMRWNWTMGNPANALRLLHDFVSTGPPVLMTWGPLFSTVATVVNEVVPQYNIVQVVLASSSTLNDRTRYPLTVRISVDEDLLNPARVAFVQKMGWTRVAIVFEDTEYFRENTKQLTLLLHQANVHVLATETVNDIHSTEAQIASLKRHDARIIFAGFLPDQAAIFFCKVFQLGLYGSKIVWIIPGWFPDGWWRNPDPEVASCTSAEMEEVLQFAIGFDGDQFVPDVEALDFNGVKPLPHHMEYLQALHKMEDNSRDIYAYDNIFTIALILNASIPDVEKLHRFDDMKISKRLEDFSYEDAEMANIFLKHARTISFVGLTDKIEIGEKGVRNAPVYVEQFIGTTASRVMDYSDEDKTFTPVENRVIQWAGNKLPVDGITHLQVAETVSTNVQIVIYTLAGLGIALALIFLSLNIRYRGYRTVKISSPILNNLVAIGCLMLYASIVIPGLNTSSYTEQQIVILCHVQAGLVSIGISLALGALFSKTYRIHAIFKKAVERLQKINLPDSKLILGVCALVFADVIILVFRIVLDNVHVASRSLDPQLDMADPSEEIYFVPNVRTCESNNQIIFLIAMCSIKGILLMFGVFLAWETRDVTVSDLNDSKYIALSVYTVAVTMAVAVPTITVFTYRVDLRFIIFGSAVLFANTTVLCLVFVPKIWPLCCCYHGNREPGSSHMIHSSRHVIGHMAKNSVQVTKSSEPPSVTSSSSAFHFHSSDEGVMKLTAELEEKRQLLECLKLKYEQLSSVISAYED